VKGYVLGAGAHGRVVVETWRRGCPGIDLAFLDDDPALQGKEILGVPVVGGLESLERVEWRESEAVIGLGHNIVRLALAAHWQRRGVSWSRVIHPAATVSPSAQILDGTVVFARSVVNTGARLGCHVIINTGAIVEHDCVVDDGALVGPGGCIGSRVEIGRGAFIGTGVTLAPRIRVGAGTVVGAGAVVVKDLPPGVLAYGVPARVIRPLGEDFDWRRLL
jgi:UDP-N-acetylbacillosamine N-acetyltransferase